MVGFSLKKTEGDQPVAKKFGGFSLKKQGPKLKAKPLVKSKIGVAEEDDSVKKIAISTSEDLGPKEEKEVVIELKPNKTLRTAKKEVIAEEKGNAERNSTGEGLKYGLNVMGKTKKTETVPSPDDEVVTKRPLSTGEDAEDTGAVDIVRKRAKPNDKRQASADAEDGDKPDYSKVSVDDFGLAFLKGLGYKGETQSVAKKEPKKAKLYGGQKGLGSD